MCGRNCNEVFSLSLLFFFSFIPSFLSSTVFPLLTMEAYGGKSNENTIATLLSDPTDSKTHAVELKNTTLSNF